jgi:shikimate dehydrogenase
VTIPYKQLVLPLLDAVDSTATTVGAVNTIVHRAGRLEGFNTDVGGFVEALRRESGTTLTSHRVVVLGAGGAARAVVAAALRERATSLIVGARRPEQAQTLADDFRHSGLGDVAILKTVSLSTEDAALNEAVRSSDVVVNATPAGTLHRSEQDEMPIDPDLLHAEQLVVDLVYNPLETPLLRAARKRGARTLNGLPMLVYQGAMAFERWTGRDAPVELMRRIAEEALGV